MNPEEIIQALDRWGLEIGNDPLANIKDVLHDMKLAGYTEHDIDRDAPLILAWLRDPSIIDPDHDDSEAWIRRHHG